MKKTGFLVVDEAYVVFDIEGGLRKPTRGKADNMGPLDVINPLDYSDLSAMANLKIARPLVHASFILGQFSKPEAVFVPNFEAAGFAETGPWAPEQFASLGQRPNIRNLKEETHDLF